MENCALFDIILHLSGQKGNAITMLFLSRDLDVSHVGLLKIGLRVQVVRDDFLPLFLVLFD